MFTFIRSTFQPGEEVQTLDENQILHLLLLFLGLERFIQLLCGGDVLLNRDILLLPREEDAAQVDG